MAGISIGVGSTDYTDLVNKMVNLEGAAKTNQLATLERPPLLVSLPWASSRVRSARSRRRSRR